MQAEAEAATKGALERDPKGLGAPDDPQPRVVAARRPHRRGGALALLRQPAARTASSSTPAESDGQGGLAFILLAVFFWLFVGALFYMDRQRKRARLAAKRSSRLLRHRI